MQCKAFSSILIYDRDYFMLQFFSVFALHELPGLIRLESCSARILCALSELKNKTTMSNTTDCNTNLKSMQLICILSIHQNTQWTINLYVTYTTNYYFVSVQHFQNNGKEIYCFHRTEAFFLEMLVQHACISWEIKKAQVLFESECVFLFQPVDMLAFSSRIPK